MALGGGTFTAQDKALPGAYINFVSAAQASTMLSDRGIVAMPLQLDWGPDGEVFSVTVDDFSRHAKSIFGYDYNAVELLPIREIFHHATKLLAFKLGVAAKAQNTFATAKYGGTRGNDIQIMIQVNVDDTTKFDVSTILAGVAVEKQTAVANAAALQDNDFVIWKDDATLAATAGTPLSGGTNGTITGNDYQNFLNKIESYNFHILGCPTDDSDTEKLFESFVQRMRDTVGVKFQMVGYRVSSADYEGVISVENACIGDGEPDYGLVYWLSGLEAACSISSTCGNKEYNGEYTVSADYTQQDLESGIWAGKLMLHRINGNLYILTDINTLITLTPDKGTSFQNNQVVRVLDQIANDMGSLFRDKYLDKIPNDASGRSSFSSDVITYNNQLVSMGAITDFQPTNISVTQGDTKKSVVLSETITPVAAMEQMYMTVIVN